MKRWLLYCVAVGILWFTDTLPFQGTDVAKLAPVESVWLSSIDDMVYMETDTGDVGIGKDVPAALEDMKKKAYGTIFIETADYLIVEQGKEELLNQTFSVFRPSCMVCVSVEKPDLVSIAAFLSTHESNVTLRLLQAERTALPVLKQTQGRLELVE